MIPATPFKYLTYLRLAAIAAITAMANSIAIAQEVKFPDNIGVIDVTAEPWNFDNTGVQDITASFQQLVNETIPRKFITSPEGYWPYIIYFPNGTYRLTNSVVGAVLNNGTALGGFVIQGESRDGVILQLDDNAAGFDNHNAPKVLLDYFAGNGTNNAFVNMLENITIDVGSGNPGAIGVRFHANNTGAVRNVTISSSDPQFAGYAGLEAVKNTNGPWLIRGLTVVGFEYGLNLGNTQNSRHMVSVQDLNLQHQRVAGIQLNHFKIVAYNTKSHNNVPFLIDLHPSAMITLINAEFSIPDAGSVSQAAIQSSSSIYLRNVSSPGFASLVSDGNSILLEELDEGEEWYNRPRNFLWESTPTRSLHLPIEQAPEPAWPDPEDWVILDAPAGALDHTNMIRAAMNSGKSTIVFRPGTYRISDTIKIPPHVQRIAGQWALLRTESAMTADGRPAFEIGPSHHNTVVLEKIRGRFDTQQNPSPLILNGSHGNLVLRDIFWVSGPIYRSEPTRGNIIIENVHSLPGSQNNPLDIPAYEFRGQNIWAWQWNPEMLFPHAVVDGARLFVLGSKIGEMRGPLVDVRNHGYAELFGVSVNVTHDHLDIDPMDTVILQSVDGNISANFKEMAQLSGGAMGWGRHNYIALETRNGERRELLNTDPSVVHSSVQPQIGAVVTLYTGYFEQDNPGNQAPELSDITIHVDDSGYIYQFEAEAVDPDSFPAAEPKVHWRTISGPAMVRTENHVGNQVTFEFDRAGDYLIEVSATDGALETRQTIPIKVSPKQWQTRLGRNDVNRYVDNAPQDGQADLFHPALLQLGDDSSNAHSHLRFELDLLALKGSEGRIRNASLRLLIDSINGLNAFTTSFATTQSFGVMDAAGFNSERTTITNVSLAGLQSGDSLVLDVLPAIQYALSNGHDYVSVWLQADFSNDNVAQFVRFASTTGNDVSQRPLFAVDFAIPDFRNSSIQISSNYFLHPTYGHYFTIGDFVYHESLGWLYLPPESVPIGTFLAYSYELGWISSNETIYPWIYRYEQDDWNHVYK